jgi:sporulation protein YtfJ
MDKIKEMADVNTVIGEAIRTDGGITIIPVSKVSFGFVSGGSEFSQSNKFAGGAGAGVTIKPAAFIVIKPDGDVKMLEIGKDSSTVEGILGGAPEMIKKLKDMFSKDKGEKAAAEEID